jgi:hypothetical protein
LTRSNRRKNPASDVGSSKYGSKDRLDGGPRIDFGPFQEAPRKVLPVFEKVASDLDFVHVFRAVLKKEILKKEVCGDSDAFGSALARIETMKDMLASICDMISA